MKNSIHLPKHLICLSHLRWDFVYQRPQHLLSRFANETEVYFYEEPVHDAHDHNFITLSERSPGLQVVVPHIKPGLSEQESKRVQTRLFDNFIAELDLQDCLFWYYTPMALSFTDKHKPKAIVYDCMDELSAFRFAHSEIISLEKQLMARADLVFTGGHSLYEAKKRYHGNIFPIPSSIDKNHFAKARKIPEASSQSAINGPKIGFFGVIDERFDSELIGEIATKKPGWQLILIGPIVKIDPQQLPKNDNIHYLGQQSYQDLPAFLAGWDMAMLPFLINASTRFISPTKTPEYLAAGIPVVSTQIRDVVHPYGIRQLVHICNTSDEFISVIEKELETTNRMLWEKQCTNFLKAISWDKTYKEMRTHIQTTINSQGKISIAS